MQPLNFTFQCTSNTHSSHIHQAFLFSVYVFHVGVYICMHMRIYVFAYEVIHHILVEVWNGCWSVFLHHLALWVSKLLTVKLGVLCRFAANEPLGPCFLPLPVLRLPMCWAPSGCCIECWSSIPILMLVWQALYSPNHLRSSELFFFMHVLRFLRQYVRL